MFGNAERVADNATAQAATLSGGTELGFGALSMASRRIGRKGFLADYKLAETYLIKPDRVHGRAGMLLSRELGKAGLTIQPVHRPRLHAKVLGWDNDALAISSLNWLSADPSDTLPNREIGVLVEAPNAADNFLRRFEHARLE